MKPMQRSLLAAAIVAALSASAYALPARAQDSQTGTTQKQDQKKAQELKTIVVTGSLIPTAEIHTATPVYTITAADIKAQGFTSLYQAIKAQPMATGQVVGEQYSNGFIPGARPAPSLLGLPPDFTLTLIDGHPIADYPLLYSQSFAVTDLSSIPLSMVSEVQIVPGNQSSIYGSAAIAGVINIILKHHAHGIDFDYRAGGYSDGGGASQRVSVVGGYNHGPFSMVYGVQYKTQQPIWAFQRTSTAGTFANPNPELRGLISPSYDVFDKSLGTSGENIIPVPNACAGLSNQFGGTTIQGGTVTSANNPNDPFAYVPNGVACGSPYMDGYTTLQNLHHSGSIYTNARFRLNQDAELYGSLMATISSDTYFSGPRYNYWETDFPYGTFYNQNTGTQQIASINFAPEADGGLLANSIHDVGRSYSFVGGIKGSIGSSNWNYDAYYARSQYNLSQYQETPLASKINAFFDKQFLGPQLGTSASGYPIYAPNYNNFYKAITPAEYNSWLGVDSTHSEAWTQNVNLQVTNTSLFKLPAGEVGGAAVVQVGNQLWHMPPNPAAAAGLFYNGSSGNGGGKRNTYATAFELHVPIFSMLSTDISARFDHFHNDGGGSSSRPTYKASFAFRPMHTLLLRANYATAFRMPSMGYSFIGPGTNYYETLTDYYQCEKINPGTSFANCSTVVNPNINYTMRGATVANPYLKPITAKSWGAGVVWSPTSDFDVSADYYNIRIANEVEPNNINNLLITDAQCLLGQIPGTSAACAAAYRAVSRNAAGRVSSFAVGPINIANENVSGVHASIDYRYNTGRYGELSFHGSYAVTLRHTFQVAPGTPYLNLLKNPFYDYEYGQSGTAYGPEYKSIVSGSVTWNIDKWSTTLYGIRYGKLPNFQAYANPTVYQTYGAGRLPPWMLYNATIRYDISHDARVTLTVNNLFNTMPPVDSSDQSFPYYDQAAYNPYGRSYFVDFNYRF